MRSSLLVIVPALNEELAIGSVVTSLRQLRFDVLVVDDCSSDQTALIAKQSGATVLSLPVNLGVGGALRTGFRYAVSRGYTEVVQVDADGQHPVHQIVDLIDAAVRLNAHLVIGSRYLSSESTLNASLIRRMSMWVLGAIASKVTGLVLTDTTSGFRLISGPLLNEFARDFPDYYLGDTFESTIAAARAGFRVVEIPAALVPRQFGKPSTSTFAAALLVFKVLIIAIANLHPKLNDFSNAD